MEPTTIRAKWRWSKERWGGGYLFGRKNDDDELLLALHRSNIYS